MLEEQEVVLGRPTMDGSLQDVCFLVVDAAQPPSAEDAATHASSASQLRVSRSCLSSRRNAAAYAPSKARWSQAKAMMPMWRTAMKSPPSGPDTAAGRRWMPSVESTA